MPTITPNAPHFQPWGIFERWINQRPGFEPGNYDRAGYRADCRLVAKQRRQAHAALNRAHDWPYDPAAMADAMHAFSGRLSWVKRPTTDKGHAGPDAGPGDGFRWELDYTAGQYWCTEYRNAALHVLECYCNLMQRKHNPDA